MKALFIISFLFFFVTVIAQDSIRKLKISIPGNRAVYTNKPKAVPLTLQQQITQKIDHFLDSMVQTKDADPFLIGKIKSGVSTILTNVWIGRSLAGTKPDEAFFVQCGTLTMSKKDIADGRLVVLIGYAKIKPAEFETLRFERIMLNKTPLQYANHF